MNSISLYGTAHAETSEHGRFIHRKNLQAPDKHNSTKKIVYTTHVNAGNSFGTEFSTEKEKKNGQTAVHNRMFCYVTLLYMNSGDDDGYLLTIQHSKGCRWPPKHDCMPKWNQIYRPKKGMGKNYRKLRYAINKFTDCVTSFTKFDHVSQPNYLGQKM